MSQLSMRALLLGLSAMLGLAPTTAAQAGFPVVQVDPDRPVGRSSPYAEVEPHLTVNLRQPKHLLAASMTVTASDLTQIDCTILTSFDGGVNWSSTQLSALGFRQARGCGDPWTAILPDGTALVSMLGDSGVIVLRSPDGGRTWPERPLLLRGAHDHPMMVVDTMAAVVYLVSGLVTRNSRGHRRDVVFVARSSDGGRTFVEVGQPVFSNLAYEAQTPLVLSDRTLVVAFMDHRDAANRRLERRRTWTATSTDGGATYSEPMLVSESCNRRGPVAWPNLAVGVWGTERVDRLYFACEAHENRGILFATSSDFGNRWTAVVRIDSISGGPATADSVWTKTPALAVSPTGVILLTWYDRRDDPRKQCQHLYAAASLDGGATFSPAVPVSQAPSCPGDGGGADVAARFPSGGEYSGLVALGPREFLALWADSRSGHYQLRSARIGVARP
jgi:hypothetical protein